MGRELGRISGPLLAENLLRNGTDLAFDNTALYLNVNTRFVGFGTSTPIRTLEINGLTQTDDLIVDTRWDIGNTLEFNTNNIVNYNGTITISPDQSTNPTIVVPGIKTDNIQFKNNTLSSFAGSDINFNPNGTGQVVFGDGTIYNLVVPNDIRLRTTAATEGFFRATKSSWEASGLGISSLLTNPAQFALGTTITDVQGPQNSFGLDYYIVFTSTNPLIDLNPLDNISLMLHPTNVVVNGGLHSTGNITFDGSITFGDANADLINIISKVNTPIIPSQDIQFNLGAFNKYFRTTYVNNYNSTTLTGKQLQPVDTINYPFTTGLTIQGSTFSIPNSGMAITSEYGTGKLQFVTNLVINGGFETGDFTNWTQAGNFTGYSAYTTIQKDLGGFDTTFLGQSGGHFGFGPYISLNGTQLNGSLYQSYDAYPNVGLTTYAVNTGDKVMFSMIITQSTDNENTGVGIGTHNTTLEQMLGATSASFGITANGRIYNGSLTYTTGAPTFTTGDIIDVSVDRLNNLLWLRVNNGLWNNNPAALPETLVGGYDISYITGTVYPGATIGYVGGFPFGYGSKIKLNQVISYIVPGGYDFALVYPSAAHGGIYFEKAGPYGAPGAISQTINTYPGATYTVGWWVKVAASYTPNAIVISFNGEILETIVNDVAKDWVFRSYTRVATGYTAELVIAYQNNPSYFYIDDISVTTKIPYFTGNRINNVTNGPLTLATSPRGYVYFDTTTGMVLPVGNDSNRMTPTVLGATRFNTQQNYTEVYNGTNWQNIAGIGGYATQDEIENIINVWSIILG